MLGQRWVLCFCRAPGPWEHEDELDPEMADPPNGAQIGTATISASRIRESFLEEAAQHEKKKRPWTNASNLQASVSTSANASNNGYWLVLLFGLNEQMQGNSECPLNMAA